MVEPARLSTDAVRHILLKRAAIAGLRGTLAEPFNPHGPRVGFVTTAYRNGAPNEAIMGHTRQSRASALREMTAVPLVAESFHMMRDNAPSGVLLECRCRA